MNVETCQTAMQANLDDAPTVMEGISSGPSSTSDMFQSLLDAFHKFLHDYVSLPPKDVALQAFTQFIDSAMLMVTMPGFAKDLLRRTLLIAADSSYDLVAKYRS